MKLSKDLFKQIVILMMIAAAIVLVVALRGSIGSGILKCLNVLTPFMAGGAIAFILNIPMSAIENRLLSSWDSKPRLKKFKRATSLIMTLLLIILLIILFISIVLPNLASTFAEIAKQVPRAVNDFINWVYTLNIPGLTSDAALQQSITDNLDSVIDKFSDFMQNGAGNLFDSVVSIFTGVIGVFVSAIVGIVFAIYALAQKETLARHTMKVLNAYVPEKHRNWLLKVASLLSKNFSSFITGQCLDAAVLGTMFVIVLFIFRVPYPLMIGVIIAFTALIPIVGAFLGCAIGCLLILIVNPIAIIKFLIIFIILQQLEGKLIYPRIVGSSVGLPAIWVFVAIAAGGSLFGVIGMLVFIPIVSTFYSLLREDVNNRVSDS